MRKETNQCDAQTDFFARISVQTFHGGDAPWWWCDLFWCYEVGCGVRWSNVVGCEVTWGEVMWLVATCHVMWCHVVVMSFDVMWFFVLCHVTWCNVMSCDVLSCDELSSVVLCNGMECWELVMRSVVRSRCVVRSGYVTMWWSKVLLCTTKYYSVLHSTTPYY